MFLENLGTAFMIPNVHSYGYVTGRRHKENSRINENYTHWAAITLLHLQQQQQKKDFQQEKPEVPSVTSIEQNQHKKNQHYFGLWSLGCFVTEVINHVIIIWYQDSLN